MKTIKLAALLMLASVTLFSCTKSDTPTPLPVAGFNYVVQPNSATPTFTNTSTNATSYSWNFGDGVSSTLATPIHTYLSVGTYTVTLTVTNSTGTAVATATFNIGAHSLTINKIQIANVNNAALYHDYVYIVFNYSNGGKYTGSPFYVANSSPNSNVVWTVSTTNPLTNISADNRITVYESFTGIENPSTDPILYTNGVNFTAPDAYGFNNNGNYSPTLNYTSGVGYYNQVYTVTWQ